MIFKNKNKVTTKCKSGTNENNCSLISRIKELQSSHDNLNKIEEQINEKYIRDSFIEYGRTFYKVLMNIKALQEIYPTVTDDIVECIKIEQEKYKINKEINIIKSELGIK